MTLLALALFLPLGSLSAPVQANSTSKSAVPSADLPKRHLGTKPKPDAVLAKVGSIPIYARDLDAYLWDWRAYEALQDLLSNQMVVAEAKRLKIVEDPVAVDRELNRQLEAYRTRLQPGQTLSQALLAEGFPKSRLWLRIRTEHLMDKIVMAKFEPKSYVKVSTIIIRSRSEQATDLAEALKRAEDAYSALRNGEPWGDALARFTDDASTLQNQGLLGWRELSAFPPTVRAEMGSLRTGAITRPAQTAHGIQIFRVDGHGADAAGAPLQELKDAYRLGSRQKYLDDLRKRTKVEVFLGK